MNKNEKKLLNIGFIGCGKMASAIIKGVITSDFLSPQQILASEVNEDFASKKKEELGIEVVTDNKIIAKKSDVIFLATKPCYVKDVLNEIKDELSQDKLIVSIAAGVRTSAIESAINKEIPVIRVMPNGPAVIMQGMSGIVKGKFANETHVDLVYQLFSNVGKCIIVDENQIDIVTAISGSGPAFFYEIIHEMALAGEKLGLEYDKSLLLAAQTAVGSANLMIQSDLTPEQLVANIATKGGCTEVGVQFMKESNTEKLFNELITKTTQKATALGS